VGRFGVGHQDHVGLVDGLPAGDRRTVEHHAVGEHVFVDHGGLHRDMLHLAARIGEAQVDEFDLVVLDVLQNVICTHLSSLWLI
jgi:hypothetical protein